jgi:hypothetical protein
VLLLLNRPYFKSYEPPIQQQREMAKYADTICGLAMTMNDYASSIMSSQCLFIGLWTHGVFPLLATKTTGRIADFSYCSAGLCLRDECQERELLRLLELRQKCSGWPINSLSADLEMIWHRPKREPTS